MSDLSPLSQHGQLYTDVASLLAKAKSLEFFYPSHQQKRKDLDRGDQSLIEQDLIRSSIFKSSGFGAEHHTARHDRIYDAVAQHSAMASANRAAKHSSGNHTSAPEMWKTRLPRTTGGRGSLIGCDSALRTACRVFQGLPSKQSPAASGSSLADEIWALIKDYKDCKTKQTLCDPPSLPDKFVGYDAERLQDSEGFLAVHWCQLHQTLSGRRHDKYSIMMLLATLAYAGDVSSAVIEVLTALFNVRAIGEIKMPDAVPYFELGSGRSLGLNRLTTTMETFMKPFHERPEYDSPSLPSESFDDMWDRRTWEWESKKREVISSILEDFQQQWPCEVLHRPAIRDIDAYIDMDGALVSIRSYVKSWWDNHRFHQYLCRIEKGVGRQLAQLLPGSTFSMSLPPPGPARGRAWLTDADLLSLQSPPLVTLPLSLPHDLARSDGADAAETLRLKDVIARLQDQANLRHEKEYVEDLQASCKGLQAQSSWAVLKENAKRCQEYVTHLYTSLVDGLNYTTHLPLGGVAAKYNSPRVNPTFFLKQLA